MKTSIKKSKQGLSLKLEGEMTIFEAAKLKETLLKHLAKAGPLEINLGEVAKIDLSGLQLLYAAQETAARQRKTLLLKNPSAAFMEAATLAGLFFQSQTGSLNGGLWEGGTKECQKPS